MHASNWLFVKTIYRALLKVLDLAVLETDCFQRKVRVGNNQLSREQLVLRNVQWVMQGHIEMRSVGVGASVVDLSNESAARNFVVERDYFRVKSCGFYH